jgi:hypothetical protein
MSGIAEGITIALCVESGIYPIGKLYKRRHDGEPIPDTDPRSRATNPSGLVCVAGMHILMPFMNHDDTEGGSKSLSLYGIYSLAAGYQGSGFIW